MIPITAVLTAVLVLFTTIVALAKTIVEYQSARLKYKTEAAAPSEVATTSSKSQFKLRRLVEAYFWVVLVFTFIVFCSMMWGPRSGQPVTVSDIGQAGLLIANFILANRNFQSAVSGILGD